MKAGNSEEGVVIIDMNMEKIIQQIRTEEESGDLTLFDPDLNISKDTPLEKIIVEVLEKSKSPRDQLMVSVNLIRHDYDVHKLVSYARMKKVYRRLGYIAELTLDTIHHYGIKVSHEKLRQIVLGHTPPEGGYARNKVIPLVPKTPIKMILYDRDNMGALNQKWGVAGSYTKIDIYDYLDLYLHVGIMGAVKKTRRLGKDALGHRSIPKPDNTFLRWVKDKLYALNNQHPSKCKMCRPKTTYSS